MKKLSWALVALVIAVPTTAWATHLFSDVEDGRFYTDPVERAADNGITFGRSRPSSCPTAASPAANR